MFVVRFAPGRFLLASLAATCWIPVFACWWPHPVLSSLSSLCWCRHHQIVGIKRKPGNTVPNHFLPKFENFKENQKNCGQNSGIYSLKMQLFIPSKLSNNFKIWEFLTFIPFIPLHPHNQASRWKSSDQCSGKLYVHKVFRKGLLWLLIIPDDFIWEDELVRLELMMITWLDWTCEIGTFEEGYWCL